MRVICGYKLNQIHLVYVVEWWVGRITVITKYSLGKITMDRRDS